MIRKLTLALAILPLLASPAGAQAWLEGLARSAVEGVAREAVGRAVSGAAQPASTPGAAPAPSKAAAKTSEIVRPSDLPKPAGAAEKKQAYEDFSRYSCSDCEGGRGYDAWARQILGQTGWNKWESKVGALAVGETLTWQGVKANGVLKVVSEDPVGGFPCKQIHYRLIKGAASAERDGLFCFGRSGPYSGSDTWVEVY
ncbi:MAG: hypothetical protein V4514_04295 [Pseudomonadota bacterium]|uniref:hypothetical protein n=1 Tax=Phenylobacterium sp. TaxID=1871053 RepID=UPI0025F8CE17|nr:hypothetical protein [Phenylobacterium sp.]MBT9469535.1 hypothetical protein [Phenylobacterium sp.]